MTKLIALLVSLCLSTPSVVAQREVGEPIRREQEDAELLELLEEFDLIEIQAAYVELHGGEVRRETETPTSLDELTALRAKLTRLEASGNTGPQEAQRLEELREELRAACVRLAPQISEPRQRLELLALLAETNLALLQGSRAHLLTLYAGMPAAEQRAEALELAGEATAAATEARGLIGEAIYELEARVSETNDAALRQELRRLREDWRDFRLPLLAGLAASAESIAANDADAAVRALEAFGVVRDEEVLSTTARLSRAAALFVADRGGQAERRLTDVLATNEALSPRQHLAASLLLARARARSEDFNAAHAALDAAEGTLVPSDATAPALWRLLLADARVRVDLTHARILTTGAAKQALLSDAIGHYDRLAADAEDLNLSQQALQALLLEKLAACALLSDIAPESLPTLALLARAQAMLVEAASSAERYAGLELFDAALQRPDLDADLARRLLAAALQALPSSPSPQVLEKTADVGLRLVPRLADDAARLRLLEHLWGRVALATQAEVDVPTATREALLDALVRTAPAEEATRWRLRLANLYVEQRRLDETVRLLLETPIEGRDGTRAAVLLAQVRLQQLQQARQTPAERTAALALLEAARRAGRALQRLDGEESMTVDNEALVRCYEAEALAALGELEEALATIEDGSGTEQPTLNIRIQRLRLRARLLSKLGRTSEAAAALRDLLDALASNEGNSLDVGALLELLLDEYETGRTPGSDAAAAKRAAEELLPLAREAVRRATSGDTQQLAAHELRLARVHVLADQAAEALAALERAAALDESSQQRARYLLARADANFLLEADEDAFADYSTLVRALTAQGVRDDVFWAATLRRLLILERQGRVEQIRPRIQRLRQMDEEMGGEPFYEEFQALLQRVVRGG